MSYTELAVGHINVFNLHEYVVIVRGFCYYETAFCCGRLFSCKYMGKCVYVYLCMLVHVMYNVFMFVYVCLYT